MTFRIIRKSSQECQLEQKALLWQAAKGWAEALGQDTEEKRKKFIEKFDDLRESANYHSMYEERANQFKSKISKNMDSKDKVVKQISIKELLELLEI